MTDQVLNKRKFLFRFRLKNQEDIIYITSFDLILIFQWDLLKETKVTQKHIFSIRKNR